MRMIEALIVDPTTKTTEFVTVDVDDYRAIQSVIGDKRFEEIVIRHSASSIGDPKPFLRICMDATAKLTGVKDRFFLPAFDFNGGIVSVVGKAVIFAVRGDSVTNKRDRLASLEIVWPDERRVTTMDKDYRTTGWFITKRAHEEGARIRRAGEDGNLNFQAILSDERFVAATRIVLTTFEDAIECAIGGNYGVPMLELSIKKESIVDALDLYDELVKEFGYSAEDELEEEEY